MISKSLKINEENLIALIAEYRSGQSTQVQLSKKYRISQGHISSILGGRWRRNVTGMKKPKKKMEKKNNAGI